jgi:hypothetical protein
MKKIECGITAWSLIAISTLLLFTAALAFQVM